MKSLAALKDKIGTLPLEEQAKLLDLLTELEEAENKTAAKDDFMAFVRMMWPSFIGGRHHKTMAEAFERVARGELKRLIINMPPRHTKSEFASYLLPAWFLGEVSREEGYPNSTHRRTGCGFWP
jgi:hypothetical protein